VISSLSASTAAYLDECPACGYGSVMWALATDSGRVLSKSHTVIGLTQVSGASFLTSSLGWVVGIQQSGRGEVTRNVRTDDGGNSWQVQYSGS
jgi:hypothetical protein